MGMRLDLGFDLSQEQRQVVSPSLIEANHILGLSQQELLAMIQQELLANPALELEERAICPTCGGVLDAAACPTCRALPSAEQREVAYEDYPEILTQQGANGIADDEFDPLNLVATEISLQQQMLSDVATLLDEADLAIAAWLIDCLDERGYLAVPLAEVAEEFGVPEARVEAVLCLLQQVVPVGVAARDMRESLLLQIDYLTQQGTVPHPQVRRIVASHLDDLASHKHGHIAALLGIAPEEVDAAREFIRTHLSPFPLQRQEARPWKSPNPDPYVVPDVIILLVEDELFVEISDAPHHLLRLNETYAALAATLVARNGSLEAVNDHGKLHIRDMAGRAKLFIANVRQRRETLRRIATCLVELQGDFLRGGVRELRPLTRAVVAQQVGVHESTVSRATANKFVMLPTRQVIPFSDFFTPSLSIKDVIREMIVKERAKGRPLTDREICDRLLLQGIRIARRTVAKYRAELGILPSTMR